MNYDPNEGRVYERTYNKLVVTNVGSNPKASLAHAAMKNNFKLKFKVGGLTEGRSVKLERSVDGSLFFDKDGEYEADIAIGTIGFKLQGYQENESCNVTIEQIPEYQGALVSDGVDDYGLCNNFPILNKEDGYTVLAIRKWINILNNHSFVSNEKESANTGAFSIEYYYGDHFNTYSWGTMRDVGSDFDENFVFQTSDKYNNKNIAKGDVQTSTDNLTVFTK